jgi:mercuric ion binding protein
MKHLIAVRVATALTASTALAEGLRTVTLDVTNMDCAVCPITVREALEKVLGVTSSANVDFASKRAEVVFDPKKASVDALTNATANAGYPSRVQQVQRWQQSCWIRASGVRRAGTGKKRRCPPTPACGFTDASIARPCSGRNLVTAACTARTAATGALRGSNLAAAALMDMDESWNVFMARTESVRPFLNGTPTGNDAVRRSVEAITQTRVPQLIC